jgi:hypothetical protein
MLDQSVGTHQGVAQSTQGHLFPSATSTFLVNYTIEGKLDANAPPCYTPPVNQICEVPADGPTSTNLNDLWVNVDTRSSGHLEYVDGGLHVWTDDNTSQAKVSEGYPVNFALKNTGQIDLDWTGTSPAPGVNLFVTFESGKTGTLVWESVYGGADLWLTNGSNVGITAPQTGGGFGSNRHGTINEWLALYPDAQVNGIAYSYGSGIHGDGVIHSITVGCTTYYFDYQQPAAPEPKIEYSNWEDSEWVCGDTEVTQYRIKTTTPYIWDAETKSYIEGESTNEQESQTRQLSHEEIGTCPLLPGDIEAKCVSDVPYLAYDLDLPEGFEADSETPLTITFVNPDGDDYVVTNQPLSGELLWPGANASPKQWPGWTLDGTAKTDDPSRFGWTREGVTVRFDVNPTYSTEVAYPAATALCANPPAVVPPTTTPTPTPAATPVTTTGLASTGSDALPYLMVGLIGLVVGGALLIWGLIAARRQKAIK